MRGVSEEVLKLMVGMIIAIITVFMFYVLFPRSSCDDLARISLEEVKLAIECAAGEGKQGCSKDAVVKLCQESKWSLTGVGYIQAYYGLMVPQYLLYYQKIQTKPVEETKLGERGGFSMPVVFSEAAASNGFDATKLQKWSETYPFERSTIGERWWDIGPTLTRFKQFYRTKYLQEGCTTGKGLCLNVRGLEQNFTLKLPQNIVDIKLERSSTPLSLENPKFYLAAPCYAKVSFKKSGSEIIANVARAGADASNYCYADEGLLNGLVALYAGEDLCFAADVATDILSFGSKAAAKRGAAKGATVAAEKLGTKLGREVIEQIAKDAEKEAIKVTGKYGGRETARTAGEIAAGKVYQKTGQIIEHDVAKEIGKEAVKVTGSKKFLAEVIGRTAVKKVAGSQGISWNKLSSLYGVPCLDAGDLCRGAFSCAETLMWPGIPFTELTPEKMKTLKTRHAAEEIFVDCCEIYNYGAEKDIDKINCVEPEEIVTPIRNELRLTDTQPFNLTTVGKYMGFISKEATSNSCSILRSENYRICETSDEGLAAGRICANLQTHTYRFNEQKEATVIEIYAGVLDTDDSQPCSTEIKTEIATGEGSWRQIDKRAAKSFPERVSIILKSQAGQKFAFDKIKISDATGRCKLDYSSISVDPSTEAPVQASAGTPYKLTGGKYNFFIVPESYSTKASKLCGLVANCDYVKRWNADTQTWATTFGKEKNQGDFPIAGSDKIGISVAKDSSITFVVSG
ncbi:MAG TPA: hypothetical protein VI933_03820 [archaeon]|nr:hypothetical protein [archaeon]